MMNYTIREYTHYCGREVLPLYAAVGWTNYTSQPDMLRHAFEHSLLTLAAYDGDRLLGLIRAVGDGYSVVFIQDILVDPACQRQGIGSALLHRLMERYPAVYQLQLMTDRTPKTVAFYKSMGFTDGADLGCAAFMRLHLPDPA